MTVKMLHPIKVYKDGIHPITAMEGELHELPDQIAKGLVRDKYAVEYKGENKNDSEVSAVSGQSKLAGSETQKVDTAQKSK